MKKHAAQDVQSGLKGERVLSNLRRYYRKRQENLLQRLGGKRLFLNKDEHVAQQKEIGYPRNPPHWIDVFNGQHFFSPLV